MHCHFFGFPQESSEPRAVPLPIKLAREKVRTTPFRSSPNFPSDERTPESIDGDVFADVQQRKYEELSEGSRENLDETEFAEDGN